MTRPILLLPLVFWLQGSGGSAVSQPAASAARAEWIARQVHDRDTGRDARATLRMRLVDRHGRSRERTLRFLRLEGTARLRSPTNRTSFGAGPDGDRLIMRFLAPSDIKGTGFLVWEHPDSEDERFLYLPSLGRVRRIAGEETQESFVGSDFTYEDIGGTKLNEYTYALLDENAVWTAPDARTHPVWRLESTRKDRRARFPRAVSLVRKDNFVTVAGDFFNRRNEREKVFTVHKLEAVEGIWTVLEMSMTNLRDRTRTDLSVEQIDYNVGLSEQHFTRRELESGGR